MVCLAVAAFVGCGADDAPAPGETGGSAGSGAISGQEGGGRSGGTGGTAGRGGSGGQGGSGACSGTADCVDCKGRFYGPRCVDDHWTCVPPPECAGSGGKAGGGGGGESGAGAGAGGAGGQCSDVGTHDGVRVKFEGLSALCEEDGVECPLYFAALNDNGLAFFTRTTGCGWTRARLATAAYARDWYFEETKGELFGSFIVDDIPIPPCDAYGYVGGQIPEACGTAETCVIGGRAQAQTSEERALPWCDGYGGAGGGGAGGGGAGGAGGTTAGAGGAAGQGGAGGN